MSSIRTTVHESLPYIDPEPTQAERAAAQALIDAELSTTPSTSPSPSTLPPAVESQFSPLITQEHARIASGQTPLAAIDQSRYETQEEDTPTSATDLQKSLARAYTADAYLSGRQTHLQLLERFGRNAWLVGNWQLEAELAALERELEAARREVDIVNIARRRVQDEVGGELAGLEGAWRRSVGRVLETEVATEGMRLQVLERQRGAAA
ncbi:Uu.00g102900.m01.CDS01 [Anthostomella pinea]|uniref:Uu.00g102900.m01.CDS01 n=1 Tax=Anthostomella pinea TaxID=933095 RepID=A0AAI8VDF0_9PEZI|nr:Uu.00g102900.m01.CDS01 [Anthostomella pinea]